MDTLTIILLIALLGSLALAAGVLVWSLKNSSRVNALSGEKAAMETELGVVREQLAEAGKSLEEVRKLEVERAGLLQKLSNAEERLGERDEVEKRFKDTFKALSSEVLKSQQESFKANAEETLKARQEAVEKLVKPLSEKIESLDKARAKNAGEFQTQISNLMQANRELASEAQTLSNALKRPDVRGRWGETQLERVLELSGLRKDIDFTVQDSFDSEGERIRTDVIVHLPQDRTVILDSKVSLTALMEAFETDDDETRSAAIDRHVSQVKSHVDSLAKKEYWSVLASTPDMVVMVLPEFAFLPAIEREPGLTERALEKNVVIVTPPALLALLKAVEMSWQQIRVAETARQISDLGKEMYDRLAVFAGHYVNVGNSLRQAIERYNRSVGSWDTRVATSAQRFTDLNVPITRELPEVPPVEAVPGSIQKLTDGKPEAGKLADGKSADGKSADGNLTDGKPGEGQAENADGRVVDKDE